MNNINIHYENRQIDKKQSDRLTVERHVCCVQCRVRLSQRVCRGIKVIILVRLYHSQPNALDAKILKHILSLLTDILQSKISVSESCFAEDSGLVGYDAVSLGEQFPTFRRNLVPSYSGSTSPRRTCFVITCS